MANDNQQPVAAADSSGLVALADLETVIRHTVSLKTMRTMQSVIEEDIQLRHAGTTQWQKDQQDAVKRTLDHYCAKYWPQTQGATVKGE